MFNASYRHNMYMEFSSAQNIKIIWTSFSSLASISRRTLLQKIPPKLSWKAVFHTNFLIYLTLKEIIFSHIKCKKKENQRSHLQCFLLIIKKNSRVYSNHLSSYRPTRKMVCYAIRSADLNKCKIKAESPVRSNKHRDY